MPSKSKAQQRLMGIAYAVKNGDMKLSDVDKEYRDKIQDLVDGMSLEDLKDYAETKHEDLPDKVKENIQPGNIQGMGSVTWPENPGDLNAFATAAVGSGDSPEEDEDEVSIQKPGWLLTFESFIKINESKTLTLPRARYLVADKGYTIKEDKGSRSKRYILQKDGENINTFSVDELDKLISSVQ